MTYLLWTTENYGKKKAGRWENKHKTKKVEMSCEEGSACAKESLKASASWREESEVEKD